MKKTHPESGKPYTIAGDFLLRDGKLAEARDQFRQALVTEKDKFPIPWQQVLQLDLQLRDYAALNDAPRSHQLCSLPCPSRTSTMA